MTAVDGLIQQGMITPTGAAVPSLKTAMLM